MVRPSPLRAALKDDSIIFREEHSVFQRHAEGIVCTRITSSGLFGLEGYPVTMETDAAVSESRDRVRAAIKNCGNSFPMSRVTVNLAPADKRKSGPLYDLPIMLAVLKVSGQLDGPTDGCTFDFSFSTFNDCRPIPPKPANRDRQLAP